MHHMQKIWIGTGTVAAAILGLSLLTTPAYADETIETIPPVATATTQSQKQASLRRSSEMLPIS